MGGACVLTRAARASSTFRLIVLGELLAGVAALAGADGAAEAGASSGFVHEVRPSVCHCVQPTTSTPG